MKKLTAGIFATLLAVVSVGAAHAEIASKGYVDQQVGTKADASAVSSLQGTVAGHTSQIGTINDTIGGYGDIVTHDADEFATSAQGAKADTAVQPSDITNVERTTNKTTTLSGTSTDAQYPSAKAVWDTIQAETSDIASSGELTALQGRVTTAEGEIDTLQTQMTGKANTADLGDLATLDAVGSAQITDGSVATADIADKAVTEAKLSDTVNASLDKADTALQQADLAEYVTKTAANAAYAAKTLETQVGTVSKENMGTTTATTVVAGVKEAIDAAKAADTKAGSAASAASAAQSAVDAVESTIEGYGDIVTHNAAEFATTGALTSGLAGKLDKTGTAARATADASGNEITATYATKAEIADLATDENLALKQDKTDNTLETTSKTVVGAINEVRGTANTASSTATAAKSAAATAQEAAEAAQTAADSKLPTATYNSQVGTVSATNMGTTASTVVTAIKEVAGEASTAQSTATAAQKTASQAQQTASQAQQTANAAIPAPSDACADSENKCVLVSSGAGNYSWEVIARGSAE